MSDTVFIYLHQITRNQFFGNVIYVNFKLSGIIQSYLLLFIKLELLLCSNIPPKVGG